MLQKKESRKGYLAFGMFFLAGILVFLGLYLHPIDTEVSLPMWTPDQLTLFGVACILVLRGLALLGSAQATMRRNGRPLRRD